MREEIGPGNQMSALGFQTEGLCQKSLATNKGLNFLKYSTLKVRLCQTFSVSDIYFT